MAVYDYNNTSTARKYEEPYIEQNAAPEKKPKSKLVNTIIFITGSILIFLMMFSIVNSQNKVATTQSRCDAKGRELISLVGQRDALKKQYESSFNNINVEEYASEYLGMIPGGPGIFIRYSEDEDPIAEARKAVAASALEETSNDNIDDYSEVTDD